MSSQILDFLVRKPMICDDFKEKKTDSLRVPWEIVVSQFHFRGKSSNLTISRLVFEVACDEIHIFFRYLHTPFLDFTVLLHVNASHAIGRVVFAHINASHAIGRVVFAHINASQAVDRREFTYVNGS